MLFVALAKEFGLALNGMTFAAIAQSIPFNIIRKSTDPIEIEAILLGQAGLLDSDVERRCIQRQIEKDVSICLSKIQTEKN